MQRISTKQSRGPNADEKAFQAWLKQRPCIIGSAGITEVHHCKGSTFKHNKVHIGHWFCLPLSQEQHRAYHAATKAWQTENGGQAFNWMKVYAEYSAEIGEYKCPNDVYESIRSLV